LVDENEILEPYNETLKDKGVNERRAWAESVIKELQTVSDLTRDEFVVLAGKV